nr:probably inactive leucine-rich repeat receptor-like protein kinase At5g48380 [Tanacetum cinerariifolium]
MGQRNKATIISCVMLLISIAFSNAIDTDINCLKAFKDSMEEDPLEALSTWNFSNITEGYICTFNGIDCWNSNSNRVLNIRLANLGLKGMLPLELASCTSMTGLDLSGNLFYGTLPTNISIILPFVTSLDLSSNNFSGQIPGDLANCSFLNVVRLQNNAFSGQIPLNLGRLTRIREFNVANNSLSGPVPVFRNGNISAESYAGNSGLCGGPLPPCEGPVNKTLI